MSDNVFIMHFCQFQPENYDAKCILLSIGNWLHQFDCESCETCFQNNHSNLFMALELRF